MIHIVYFPNKQIKVKLKNFIIFKAMRMLIDEKSKF